LEEGAEMMFWYGPGMTGSGYALMTIGMVLFWALVIFGVVALIRFFTRADQPPTTRSTPEQLLADRFARGEIDEQEYHHRLDVLRDRSRPLAKS
jgi:putative membrane protein